MRNRNSKDLNFEVDLLPVISLLAVCISFLLLTATWVQMGTMDVSQSVGEKATENQSNPPSLEVAWKEDGSLTFQLKHIRKAPKSLQRRTISAKEGHIDWDSIQSFAKKIQGSLPQVKTVLIQPEQTTSYESIIRLIDHMKSAKFNDVGIAPL